MLIKNTRGTAQVEKQGCDGLDMCRGRTGVIMDKG